MSKKNSAQDDIRLEDHSFYLNRELTLLQFHRRVLEQAEDSSVPLLERLRFLTISSANLDEFFEIRVAGLMQKLDYGVLVTGPDGLSPQEEHRRISEATHELVADQYRLLQKELIPALEAEGIRILDADNWSSKQRRWIERYFREELLPVLTPMGLDPAHSFPLVINKSLSFVLRLDGKDAFGRPAGMAVLQAPRSLPRVIQLPRELSAENHEFVLLSAVLEQHMSELFPGMKLRNCYQFRVTRNSDLWVDEEEVDDLLKAVKGELPRRQFGQAVRLEVSEDCDDDLVQSLLRLLDLQPLDLYRVPRPVNLHRLSQIYTLADRPDLKYPQFVPGIRRRLRRVTDMFAAIRKGDLLLHHPYESFSPVLELLDQAAHDPDVLAIKQTVYRTDSDATMIEALLAAARAGKEVTAVVEVRARFDEEHNIDLAQRLQEAGANVVYGIVGYKAHCKLLLVVRREEGKICRYVHLGTGNYHPGTARAYTDFGYMTCAREVAEDVHNLFLQITGLGRGIQLNRLLHAPTSLHRTMLRMIGVERDQARKGKTARIAAKMNSLSDPSVIRALYEASRAGVKIDLVVRGICRLRPGVIGLSENIRVRSIVGRFLEHSRVYYFYAGGKEVLYLSSADWMERNLSQRVEAAFPIEDARLRARVLEEAFTMAFDDNTQAWELMGDGNYRRLRPGKSGAVSLQATLMQRYSEQEFGAGDGEESSLEIGKPQPRLKSIGPGSGSGGGQKSSADDEQSRGGKVD